MNLERSLESGHRSVACSAVDAAAAEVMKQQGSFAVSGPTAPLALRQLWTAVGSRNAHAAHAASVALVGLVARGALPLPAVLAGFTDGAARAKHGAPIAAAVCGLLKQCASSLSLSSSSSARDLPSSFLSFAAHPLVVFVAARQGHADAWSDVLLEVDALLADASCLRVVLPFVRFVYLNPLAAAPGATEHLTHSLLELLQSDTPTDETSLIVDCLLGIVKSSPALHNAPLDMLVFAILEGLGGNLNCLSSDEKTSLILSLASFVFDLKASGMSLLRPLRLLKKLTATELVDLPVAYIFAIATCQLMLEYSDNDRECICILGIMADALRVMSFSNTDATHNVLACCVYPLTSLISEVPGKSSTTVRKMAFEMLERVGKDLRAEYQESPVDSISSQLKNYASQFSSTLGVIITSLSKFLDARDGLPNLIPTYPTPLRPLFLTSFLFHNSPTTRLTTITLLRTLLTSTDGIPRPSTATTQPSTPRSHLALSLLPTILYTLNTDPTPDIQHALLTTLLPSLVTSHHDPFVTSSILRLVTTFLGTQLTTYTTSVNHAALANPALTGVGVRVLCEVWKAPQPKVWGALKGVLGAWIARRKGRSVALKRFGKKSDERGCGEVEVEVAVVVTIHEVCKLKTKEHGQDLLPFAISLLELGSDETLVLTRVLALETVNLCIEAGITDPRANTEAYQTFKLDILSFYVLHMLNLPPPDGHEKDPSPPPPTSTTGGGITHFSPSVRSAAFSSLSAFPPPDLYPYLPPPTTFLTALVQECQTWTDRDEFHAGPSTALTSLVEHEVVNMRRAVVKALATEMGVGKHALDEAGVGGGGEVQKARGVVKSVAGEGRERWVVGKGVAAAVRAGMAAFALFVPYSLMGVEEGKPKVGGLVLVRLGVYKDLVNGLRDLSVSDHALVRVESVRVWVVFWVGRLRAMGALGVGEEEVGGGGGETPMGRVEWLVGACLEELEKRLGEARQSGVCANVVCSLTGLISAAVTLGVPGAAEHVTRLISLLSNTYARPFGIQAAAAPTDFQKSDEVQFAVCMSLAHLAKLLFPTDEESFEVISARLRNELMVATSADGQSGFAAGYGLTIVLRALIQSPSPIDSMIQELVSTVCSTLVKPSAVSPNALIGLAMGLANCLADVKEYLDVLGSVSNELAGLVSQSLERFRRCLEEEEECEEGGVVEGLIADCWVLSASVCCGVVEDEGTIEEVMDGIQAMVGRAESDPSRSPFQAHGRVCFNRILITRSTSSSIQTAIQTSLSLITKPSTPSATKISLSLSIPALFGIDAGNATFPNDPTVLQHAISNLHAFLNQSSNSPEPKVARILGWMLGKMVWSFESFYEEEGGRVAQIDAALQNHGGGGGGFSQSRQKDPHDYRRLNPGSSFLRAAFDALSAVCGEGVVGPRDVVAARMILEGLIRVGGEAGKKAVLMLPLVNWTRILTACFGSGDRALQRVAFEFAVVHAREGSAKSLVDFFVGKMGEVVVGGVGGVVREEFAFGARGVGKLMELSGLDCRVGGECRITVAPSKVLEVVQAIVYFVYFEGSDASTDDMVSLAEVLQKSLSSSNGTKLPDSLAKLKVDVIALLCDAFLALPQNPESPAHVIVIRRLICAALVAETPQTTALLLQVLSPNSWTPKHVWALLCILETASAAASKSRKEDSSSTDWIHSHIQKLFINKDHLFVRMLQQIVADPPQHLTTTDSSTSSLAATLTYLQHVVLTFQTAETDVHRSDVDIAVFKLNWIVRYLDVLIIACAGGNGAGVDFGWSQCLAGALMVLAGCGDGLRMRGSELVHVDASQWGTLGKCVVQGVVDLIVFGSEEEEEVVEVEVLKRIQGLQTQVVKRLMRVLECTVTEERMEARKQQARIVVCHETYCAVRDVLLRVRDEEEVCEGWIEVVAE
ncbi:hypothetical protein HDU98_006376 [Podochytrium sp. JEL0797]|nr:hypothetical protein HDU98_006376 [Podochytrium sp. JEL0797]